MAWILWYKPYCLVYCIHSHFCNHQCRKWRIGYPEGHQDERKCSVWNATLKDQDGKECIIWNPTLKDQDGKECIIWNPTLNDLRQQKMKPMVLSLTNHSSYQLLHIDNIVYINCGNLWHYNGALILGESVAKLQCQVPLKRKTWCNQWVNRYILAQWQLRTYLI